MNAQEKEWRVLTRGARVAAIDWDAVPPETKPNAKGGAAPKRAKYAVVEAKKSAKAARRLVRKRREVDSFYAVLVPLLETLRELATALPGLEGQEPGRRPRVVDFGCGSGALLLPIAASLPDVDFVGVDFNAVSVDLLGKRAAASGLANVAAKCGMIQDFSAEQRVDVVLGLHACGAATDMIIEQAMALGAAYVVSPCCIGKLAFCLTAAAGTGGGDASATPGHGGGGGMVITHPRSKRLTRHLQEFCDATTASEAPGVAGCDVDDGNAIALGSRGDEGSVEAPAKVKFVRGADAIARSLMEKMVRLADSSTTEDPAITAEAQPDGESTCVGVRVAGKKAKRAAEDGAATTCSGEEGEGDSARSLAVSQTVSTVGLLSTPNVRYPEREAAAKLCK